MIKRWLNRVGRSYALPMLILLLMGLFRVDAAVAQENASQPAIQQMRVQIMPEYDDPRVLVIAQGRLDVVGGDYNGPVTFRIPAGAQINQMAVLDLELGGPQFQPFDTEIDPNDSDWMLVSYTLTNPHFFYEYYYPLPASGSQKQFAFSLKNPVDINSLTIEVQQPLQAEAFTLEPTASTSRSDTAGFTFWQYADQTAGADEEISLQVRYTKSDPNPSVVRQQEAVGETQVISSAVNEQPPTTNPPSWIAFTLIGVALVIGVGLVRHRLQPQEKAVVAAVGPMSPVSMVKEPTATAVPNSSRPKFCTQCGQELPAQARFCPYCGQGVKG